MDAAEGRSVTLASADRTASRSGPLNGDCAEAMAYITQPKLNRSDRGVTGWPRACSGAMNDGVPAIMSLEVICVPSLFIRRAKPKSSSRARPESASSQTFDGLRSRWTRPRA